MKKLMTAAMFGLGMAAIAATADYQVYSFQQTGKAFDAAKDKVATEKVNGLAVYDGDKAVAAFTWGVKKDTTFTAGSDKKLGKKAFTGKVADLALFLDQQQGKKKVAYGYTLDKNAGYGTGTAKSVKGNFVGDKTFGTWQVKLDTASSKKFANGTFADLNALLEAKNVEVTQW